MTKTMKKNISINNKNKTKTISIICAFLICFVYGALLLMVGYTQGGLKQAIWGNHGGGSANKVFTFLLLGQSIGIVCSTFLLGFLLKKVNVRWILSIGYLLAIGALVGISQLDKISNHGANSSAGIAAFLIFSFLLGLFMGTSSPIASTYLSAIFKGKKRETMLSLSNGFYGIGAGIIPLAISSVLYNLNQKSSFDNVRYFYYIAIGLALFGSIIGFFINYRHSVQQTSSKIIKKGDANSKNNFNLWVPLGLIIAIMSAYMISETIANYMFVNASGHFASHGVITVAKSKSIAIEASMSFGLFVLIQGLWRAISGLTVTKKVSNSVFITCSAVFIVAAFVAILGGAFNSTNYKWGMYVVAILLAFGLGNCWPMIYSYAVSVDHRRATFIGWIINLVSMIWIPLTQVLCAVILLSGQDSGYDAIIGVGLAMSIVMIGSLVITSLILAKRKITTG